MIDFSGINLPFNVTELLGIGMKLLLIVGPFVLLGLVFKLNREIMWAIRTAINWHNIGKQYNKDYAHTGDKWTHMRTIKTVYERGRYKNWGRWYH